jgi:hypothetical protein
MSTSEHRSLLMNKFKDQMLYSGTLVTTSGNILADQPDRSQCCGQAAQPLEKTLSM